MLSKHSLPSHWGQLTETNAFQADVEDLFAANQISANRCEGLLKKAASAGVAGLAGSKRKQSSFKSAARNLKRRKQHDKFRPDVYVWQGPGWDRKTGSTVMV